MRRLCCARLSPSLRFCHHPNALVSLRCTWLFHFNYPAQLGLSIWLTPTQAADNTQQSADTPAGAVTATGESSVSATSWVGAATEAVDRSAAGDKGAAR